MSNIFIRLNGGTLNYGTGPFDVGEVGTGTLNINGGTITGSGVFYVNSGGIAVPEGGFRSRHEVAEFTA
jgi:hypothetical protein